jgi:membrane protein DedA with SNARE-associated domain
MTEQLSEKQAIHETAAPTEETVPAKKSSRKAYALGILGVAFTAAAFAAIIVFNKELRGMQQWGYLGAFLISILGGATVIIYVPMQPVVFALGGAMAGPWQVLVLGLAAAAGEVIGGLTIYMTGQGAGKAISNNKNPRFQRAYQRMLNFIRRRGAIALFLVTFIMNPFFYPAAFACGALCMDLKKFVPVIIAGKIVKCMTIVYAGYFGFKALFNALGIAL